MKQLILPITIILLTGPTQQANLTDVRQEMARIAANSGLRISLKTQELPHPDYEANVYSNRIGFLFELEEHAKTKHLTKSRVYYFIALNDEAILFGQSRLGPGLPKYAYGSGSSDAYVSAVIAWHEIGHAFNLGHVNNSIPNIMNTDAILKAQRGERLEFNPAQAKRIQEFLRRIQNKVG